MPVLLIHRMQQYYGYLVLDQSQTLIVHIQDGSQREKTDLSRLNQINGFVLISWFPQYDIESSLAFTQRG